MQRVVRLKGRAVEYSSVAAVEVPRFREYLIVCCVADTSQGCSGWVVARERSVGLMQSLWHSRALIVER